MEPELPHLRNRLGTWSELDLCGPRSPRVLKLRIPRMEAVHFRPEKVCLTEPRASSFRRRHSHPYKGASGEVGTEQGSSPQVREGKVTAIRSESFDLAAFKRASLEVRVDGADIPPFRFGQIRLLEHGGLKFSAVDHETRRGQPGEIA